MRKVVKRSRLSPAEAGMKSDTPVKVARASRAIVSLPAGLAILGLLGCTNVETVQPDRAVEVGGVSPALRSAADAGAGDLLMGPLY
jgi:hypothetical protein